MHNHIICTIQSIGARIIERKKKICFIRLLYSNKNDNNIYNQVLAEQTAGETNI
jgi:hypothetical protein